MVECKSLTQSTGESGNEWKLKISGDVRKFFSYREANEWNELALRRDMSETRESAETHEETISGVYLGVPGVNAPATGPWPGFAVDEDLINQAATACRTQTDVLTTAWLVLRKISSKEKRKEYTTQIKRIGETWLQHTRYDRATRNRLLNRKG